MVESDCFVELKFSADQLHAIVNIYNKYFLPKIINQPYVGRGFVFSWGENIVWETGKGLDINHNNIGFTINECNSDPLWDMFSDILPYMGKTAVITKMPAGDGMFPHVDRKWRPEAIYIPISGCTDKCVSKIYDMPIPETQNSTHIKQYPDNYVFEYAITTQPYLTNTHVWHSVQNFSNFERVTFGWNFSAEAKYSFDECKKILTNLKYT